MKKISNLLIKFLLIVSRSDLYCFAIDTEREIFIIISGDEGKQTVGAVRHSTVKGTSHGKRSRGKFNVGLGPVYMEVGYPRQVR